MSAAVGTKRACGAPHDGGALFFIVIGDGRGAKMPARQRFAGPGHCYFLVEYNGE
jgi:hypothetical protein